MGVPSTDETSHGTESRPSTPDHEPPPPCHPLSQLLNPSPPGYHDTDLPVHPPVKIASPSGSTKISPLMPTNSSSQKNLPNSTPSTKCATSSTSSSAWTKTV